MFASFQVPAGLLLTSIPAISGASIVICITGSAKLTNRTIKEPITVKRGTVLFISANEEAHLQVESDSGMLLYRAYAGC